MRQGNPAWAAQERDGQTPIRSDDKFYENATGNPQPDWVDLNHEVSVPQADEQQRLLVNLIQQMNRAKKPLPRFWYLPSGFKAAVVMTANNDEPTMPKQRIAVSPCAGTSMPSACNEADASSISAALLKLPLVIVATNEPSSEAARSWMLRPLALSCDSM